MKVKELIAMLQAEDPEAEVAILAWDSKLGCAGVGTAPVILSGDVVGLCRSFDARIICQEYGMTPPKEMTR